MSLNWDDEDVVGLMDCYRDGEIKTLEGLRLELHDITGVFVTTKTLSVRLRGLRTQNSGGRPKKQQLTADDSNQRRSGTSQVKSSFYVLSGFLVLSNHFEFILIISLTVKSVLYCPANKNPLRKTRHGSKVFVKSLDDFFGVCI